METTICRVLGFLGCRKCRPYLFNWGHTGESNGKEYGT